MPHQQLVTKPGTVALVTGGGNGIGAAFCGALAERGCRVVVTDIDPQSAQRVAAELPQALDHTLDVGDPRGWRELRDRLQREGLRPDLLVNNAGQLMGEALLASEPERAEALVRVNLLGAIYGCQEMLPWMAEGPRVATGPARGVINLASIFAALSPPGFAVYSATKGGVVSLTEALRGELRPLGLKATVVLPGLVGTGLFERARYASTQFREATQRQASTAHITPQQVAAEAIAAFERGKLYAVVGRRARWFWTLKHLLATRTIDAVAQRSLNAVGEESFRVLPAPGGRASPPAPG